MKKIVTAINNPNLNNKLKEEKNIEVLFKDIQYKDAILEILNKNSEIDFIIINQNIPGEINDENLIKKIKEKNKKIKIIYILEKQNSKIEKILKENNINDIYFNNEINLNEILNIINQNENDEIKNEIEELKKILYEKENKKINNKIINLLKNKLIKIKNININKLIKLKNKKLINLEKNKIITISGPPNVGKTNFIINLFKINKNKKILIIDFDLKKQNIYSFLGIKKYSKKIKNKKINSNEKIKNLINNFLIKLNKYNYLISGLDLLSDFFNNNDEGKIKNLIQDLFQNLKNNYEIILIDLGSENNFKVNNNIIKNSNLNIFLIEGNLIGINKFKNYIDKNNFENINNNLNKIIINKKDNYCIDKNILNKIFEYEILGEIKYKKINNNLINKNYKLNLNKKYKKDYKKIYKKIMEV